MSCLSSRTRTTETSPTCRSTNVTRRISIIGFDRQRHARQSSDPFQRGLSVEMPLYDFVTHTRSDDIEIINPKPVVIVEGILIFAEPRVLDLLDVRVFVDTPDDVRLMRRLRQHRWRGRTFERTLEQYERTIRPMHFEFVEPSKRNADIIIPEGSNTGVTVGFFAVWSVRS